MAFDSNGEAFVLCRDGRIAVYNLDGRFKRAFSFECSNNPQPQTIVADGKGRIYVVDWLRVVVHVLRRDGSFVFSFTRQGYDFDTAASIEGIAITANGCILASHGQNGHIAVRVPVRCNLICNFVLLRCAALYGGWPTH